MFVLVDKRVYCVMVVESGKLFMFGDNVWGQLGLGHMDPVQKPSRVKRK